MRASLVKFTALSSFDQIRQNAAAQPLEEQRKLDDDLCV
jgi:hypothetical protein